MSDVERLSTPDLKFATSGASPKSDLVSTLQASRILGRNGRTVRRAIERGELPAIKVGSAYRIAAEDLMRYAARTSPHARSPARAQLVTFPATFREYPALPEPLSSFVGRDDDVAAVRALLTDPSVRLLTLTGPGGIGKTRLSLVAAAAMRDRFPGGVVFVALATLSQPSQVIPAIFQALGLRETAGRDRRAQLRAFLADKRLLLVLDNVEHLLEAAPALADLLQQTQSLTLLATSRAPLRIAGEHEFPVVPLSLPEAGSPVDLLKSDAARLFVERAWAHDPAFTVDAETAPLIAEICARLEGLPLAIELAAVRASMLTPLAMRDRLVQRLPLLTGGLRDAPRRHRTMRDAIAWSYELLSPEEQSLFRWLAVFTGGFTLEAAEKVAFGSRGALPAEPGAEERAEDRRSTVTGAASSPERRDFPSILDLVGSLHEQSLLTRELGPSGEPRFRMLETVREYGVERLASEAGEAERVRAEHAHYFLRLARATRPFTMLLASRARLSLMEADDANLRGALTWFDEHGHGAEVVGLVVACWRYWYASGRLSEAARWLERASAMHEAASPHDRARLAIATAELLMIRGAPAEAEAAFAAGMPWIRATGDPFDLAMALLSRGASLKYGEQFSEAERQFEEALTLVPAIEPPELRQTVAGRAFGNLGTVARARGDFELAQSYGEQSLRCYQDPELDLAEASALADLGELARFQGNLQLAIERYLAAIERMGEEGDSRVFADSLLGLAIVASAGGQRRKAVLLFSAAATLRERGGFAMVLPGDAAIAEQTLATLRTTLGEPAFSSSWAEGRDLPLSEVMALAATLPTLSGTKVTAPAAGAVSLTRREQDVLRLLVAGQTDRQIAEALFIGARTVSWHVRAILGKLEARTRRDAVERARATGLI